MNFKIFQIPSPLKILIGNHRLVVIEFQMIINLLINYTKKPVNQERKILLLLPLNTLVSKFIKNLYLLGNVQVMHEFFHSTCAVVSTRVL